MYTTTGILKRIRIPGTAENPCTAYHTGKYLAVMYHSFSLSRLLNDQDHE